MAYAYNYGIIWHMNKDQSNPTKPMPIIAAVLGIGLIIAAVVIQYKTAIVKVPGDVVETSFPTLRPIDATDHTRGVATAPMKMIEYSDLQCPFCKMLHASLKEITPEYIDNGRLQFVYRHFPLVSIHENAKDLSIASECVFKLGGEEAFWKTVDGIFGDTAEKYDMAKLSALAKDSGVNQRQYNTCFYLRQTAPLIDASMKEGADLEIKGTPFAVVISPKGKTFALERAYSADELRGIFNAIERQ
jgi:protein-disulfide isomerase